MSFTGKMKLLVLAQSSFELHGVAIAQAISESRGEVCVECLFPAHSTHRWCKSLEEAETFILAQYAWLIRRTGVVNQRVGEGEPVVVMSCHHDRKDDHAVVWETLTGVMRAHDGGVDVDQGYCRVVVERNQELLLRQPLDHTGIDEQIKWDGQRVRYE